MSTKVQVLKTNVESFAQRVLTSHPLIEAALSGQLRPRTVSLYLAGVHHMLECAPEHLERARRRAERAGRNALAEYLSHKAREETGHVRWAANDLDVMERTFAVRPPSPPSSIRELMAYLERVIESDPGQYLVYVFFAEYFTVLAGPRWVAALWEKCAVPPRALTSISKHVELDQAHVAEALREFAFLVEDTPEDALTHTLQQSTRRFERFLDEIYSHHQGTESTRTGEELRA